MFQGDLSVFITCPNRVFGPNFQAFVEALHHSLHDASRGPTARENMKLETRPHLAKVGLYVWYIDFLLFHWRVYVWSTYLYWNKQIFMRPDKTRFCWRRWQVSTCMITHERILQYLTWLVLIKRVPSSNLFPPSQQFYPTKWYSILGIVRNYRTP